MVVQVLLGTSRKAVRLPSASKVVPYLVLAVLLTSRAAVPLLLRLPDAHRKTATMPNDTLDLIELIKARTVVPATVLVTTT